MPDDLVREWCPRGQVGRRQVGKGRRLHDSLGQDVHLARVVVRGALARDESRGAHYKPEFPRRDDAQWLKSTVATFTPEGPRLRYDPVDISLYAPVERKYD